MAIKTYRFKKVAAVDQSVISRSIPSADVIGYFPSIFIDINADEGNDYEDLIDVMADLGFSVDTIEPAEPLQGDNKYFYHPFSEELDDDDDGDFNFPIPNDFNSLTKCVLIGIPDGFSNANANIDLSSSYAKVGEDKDTHQESDSATSHAIPVADELFELDLSSVLSAIEAGDWCKVNVEHNSVGGDVEYIGVKIEYT